MGGGGSSGWGGLLFQVGAGLGLVQVGDGGCNGTKGAKGQILEGIEAGNCRKEQN